MLKEIIKFTPIFKPTGANKSTLTNSHCIQLQGMNFIICEIFHVSNAKQQANAQLTDKNNLKCWYFLLHQFPCSNRNNIMSWLPKESQSKRTKSHRYHNCQRPPSCFRRITRKSRLRATGTHISWVT